MRTTSATVATASQAFVELLDTSLGIRVAGAKVKAPGAVVPSKSKAKGTAPAHRSITEHARTRAAVDLADVVDEEAEGVHEDPVLSSVSGNLDWSREAPALQRLAQVQRIHHLQARHGARVVHAAHRAALARRFGEQAEAIYQLQAASPFSRVPRPLATAGEGGGRDAILDAEPNTTGVMEEAFLLHHFRHLELQGRGIQCIDAQMRGFHHLRELSLVGNELQDVAAAHLPEGLELLSLQANR
jgi:hypothetical protein